MAIEIVSKPKTKSPSWATAIFAFSILILIALAASYFYFDRSARELSGQIQEKDSAIKETPEERGKREDATAKAAKINSFSQLLATHKKPENVIAFVQKITHPQVWFSNFSFSAKDLTVTMQGRSANFVTLGQQLLILEALQKTNVLKGVKLSGVSMSGQEGAGAVGFSLQLTLDPQILK